ncbi:hypothetical protein YC2023_083677 [Brassica napus]
MIGKPVVDNHQEEDDTEADDADDADNAEDSDEEEFEQETRSHLTSLRYEIEIFSRSDRVEDLPVSILAVEDLQTTYLKVVQDKQSRRDLFPRLWSNLAYLGRLSRTSSTWTTFK